MPRILAAPRFTARRGARQTIATLHTARFLTCNSGVTDHFAQDDKHALAIARNIVASLNRDGAAVRAIGAGEVMKMRTNWTQRHNVSLLDEVEEPKYPVEELRGVIPADSKLPFDVREVIARVVDGSRFAEFKKEYGDTLVTGTG